MIDLSVVEQGRTSANALVARLVADLGAMHWAHALEDSGARAELSDYIVGSTAAIASNLQAVAVHLGDYLSLRVAEAASTRSNMVRWGTPYPQEANAAFTETRVRLDVAKQAFFVTFGSVLDCVAATTIGIAGIGLNIHRADFANLGPMNDDEYPNPAKHQRLLRALDQESPEARDLQLAALRGMRGAMIAAGPNDWYVWALEMRNMLVHREHRGEFISLDQAGGLWRPDHLPVRDPSQSNLQGLRAAQRLLEGYYLHEDYTSTMKGLAASLNAAVTGTIEVLTQTWQARSDAPGVIVQPAAQWNPRTVELSFDGYNPGSAGFQAGMAMHLNPQEVARLRAAGLVEPNQN